MKFHPRLISSATRSLFGRSPLTSGHLPAPRTRVDGPAYPARNRAEAAVLSAPSLPALLRVFTCWAIGAGLSSAYLVWLFSDLLPNTIR